MKQVNSNNFGLVIAYVIPGVVVLCGLSIFSVDVKMWLGITDHGPSMGGFFHSTIASIGLGLVVNAVRWHVVDPLHYLSGIPRKKWDYSHLPDRVEAMEFLVSNQFRYYEFYSNMVVAVMFSFSFWVASTSSPITWQFILFVAAECVLWSASRRTLLNYHVRAERFLSDESGLVGAEMWTSRKGLANLKTVTPNETWRK